MPYADPAQRAACKHRFYLAHRDEMIARSRKHYIDHQEERKEKRKRQYHADPETAIQASKNYYEEHKDTILTATKEFRSTPEGRAKRNIESTRQRAQKLRVFVENIDRQVVFERDEGICGICGRPVDHDYFHVDHVIPLSRGGLHCYANVQTAHPNCNSKKRAKIL